MPDSATLLIGSRVPDSHLLQAGSVIGHNPAMKRPAITVRGPGDINEAILQQQAGALVFVSGVERQRAIARSCTFPLNGAADEDRASHLLGSGRDVEGMKPLHNVAGFFGLYDHIQSATVRVNDRRPGDSNFGNNVAAGHIIAADSGNGAVGINETGLPNRCGVGSFVAVSVKGVNTAVLRSYENHIVYATTGDVESGNV